MEAMQRSSTAALVLLALTGAAMAADDVDLPAPSSERFAGADNFDWSGAKIGLHGGYAWGSPGVVAGDGMIGGVHGGYDWTFGNTLAGIEGSASVADIEIDPGNRLETVVDLRARLGYSFDRVLVYGTAGGAFGRTSAGFDGRALTAGAGVDFSAGENAIFGMQYLKYRFENLNNTNASLEIDLIEGKLTYKF
jgi:outer membrane immunogenic protein